MTCQFLHASAPRCHPLGAIIRRCMAFQPFSYSYKEEQNLDWHVGLCTFVNTAP